MDKKISQDEGIRRLKLSIDRQISGELDLVFSKDVQMILTLNGLVIARCKSGDFAITEDGTPLSAELERIH